MPPPRISVDSRRRLLAVLAVLLVVLPTAAMGIFGSLSLSSLEDEPAEFAVEARRLRGQLNAEVQKRVLEEIPLDAIPGMNSVEAAGRIVDEASASAVQKNYLEKSGHPIAQAVVTSKGNEFHSAYWKSAHKPDYLDDPNWRAQLVEAHKLLVTSGGVSGFHASMTRGGKDPFEQILFFQGYDSTAPGPAFWLAWVLDTQRIKSVLDDATRRFKSDLPLSFEVRHYGEAQILGDDVRFLVPLDAQMLPLWTLVVREDPSRQPGGVQAWRSRFFTGFALLALPILLAVIWFVAASVRRQVKEARTRVDFVANVTHELKTPLTSIKMFIEMLVEGRSRSKEEEQEFLGIILRESERLSRLIDRVLTFNKLEQNIKVFDFRYARIGDIVKETVAIFRKQIQGEQELKISLTIESALPRARVDHDAIREVLLNLLANAFKYSPDDNTVIVRLYREGRWFVLDVVDRGIGIPLEEQGKIFEKFYRVDTAHSRRTEGSGLGLTICKAIVEAHKGSIGVVSAPGKGSRFTVRLPIPEQPTDEEVTGAFAAVDGQRGK